MAGFVFVALALLVPMLTSIRQEMVRRRERLESKQAQIAARHRAGLARGA